MANMTKVDRLYLQPAPQTGVTFCPDLEEVIDQIIGK